MNTPTLSLPIPETLHKVLQSAGAVRGLSASEIAIERLEAGFGIDASELLKAVLEDAEAEARAENRR